MSNDLFSIRMRASAGGVHLSGAERIVSREELDPVAAELRSRAMSKNREPDSIVITMEPLKDASFLELQALPVTTASCAQMADARREIFCRLETTGVSPQSAEKAVELLDTGPASPGRSMRGAVIMTAFSGRRLEPDQKRGIRVSRFDWKKECLPDIDAFFAASGLTHFRTREALALATKVAHAPGVIAELCWSDDPDYTAGYVASRLFGYIRFENLKTPGSASGGRVFFVDENRFDLEKCSVYLERQPVLIYL